MDEDGRQVYGWHENGKHEEKGGKGGKEQTCKNAKVECESFAFFGLYIIFWISINNVIYDIFQAFQKS